jgi:hypothetical protein
MEFANLRLVDHSIHSILAGGMALFLSEILQHIKLPSPNADLSETLASFASRGFDERETVSLLGTNLFSIVWLLLSLAFLLKKYK